MKTKEEIKDIIITWASSLPYKNRIHLYGSYVKGKKNPSDIDLAVELFDDPLLDEPQIRWQDNYENWQKYLSEKFGMKAHLELNSNDSKYIHQSLKEASLLLYDSSETEDKKGNDKAQMKNLTDDSSQKIKN